ncbi:MFS transporter [Chloroflexia bacterium SDU3-3]|nr:MFS transporter [Chloroflexia bacterium SDU3-3]
MSEHITPTTGMHGDLQGWDTIRWRARFFTIWSGQALSLTGSALTQFVLLWWITQTTGSASALTIAGMMALLPLALFGPLGGTLADRWSRRAIMIVADLITALCMVVLILLFESEQVQLWHVYCLVFIRSTMQAFQNPAAAASTSMLVPPTWLTRASGMNQTLQGLMSVAAAPLGAVALGVMPLQGALMIDVVTAILGITPLLFYRIPQPSRGGSAHTGIWQDFRQGLRMLGRSRGLLWLYGLMMLMIGVLMPSFMLLPLLVRNDFGGGAGHVAFMESLSGAGMLLGGLLISAVALPWKRIHVVLVGYALSNLAVVLTGLVPNDMFWLAVLWWFLSSVLYVVGNAPIIAIIQTIVPNQLQGRALALSSTMVGLAGPLGLALAAPLTTALGPRGLLVGGGVLATLITLVGFLSPSLMRIEEQRIQE